jgi:hypothetical protein
MLLQTHRDAVSLRALRAGLTACPLHVSFHSRIAARGEVPRCFRLPLNPAQPKSHPTDQPPPSQVRTARGYPIPHNTKTIECP